MILLVLNDFWYALYNVGSIGALLCIGGMIYWALAELKGYNNVRIGLILVFMMGIFIVYFTDPNSPRRVESQKNHATEMRLKTLTEKIHMAIVDKGHSVDENYELLNSMFRVVKKELNLDPALLKETEDWIATLNPKRFVYAPNAKSKNETQSQQETKSKNQSQTELSVKEVTAWIILAVGVFIIFRP